MCIFIFFCYVPCICVLYKCYGEAIKLYPGPIIPCAPDTEKQSPNTGILQLSTSPPSPTLASSSSPSRSSLSSSSPSSSSLSSSYKRRAKDPLRNAQELGQLSKDAWRGMKNFLTGMRMRTIMHNSKDFKKGKKDRCNDVGDNNSIQERWWRDTIYSG